MGNLRGRNKTGKQARGGTLGNVPIFNGRVFLLAGQSKSLRAILLIGSPVQLQPPFLLFLLFRYDCYAQKQRRYAKNCYYHAQNEREFFKEITCQGYCYNSLAQVRDHFTNKFSTFFSNDYHQKNFNIEDEICQGENYRITEGEVVGFAG
ncbi:MAG: hypothetical protein JXL82_04785 [Candidatus Omnitrophica bacterium]|nr:hypothetical protein [Candidatus Omnitrophota bacterium]